MRLLELRRTLGAHAGTTAVLWNVAYRAISEQLARLMALAGRAVSPESSAPLSPAVAREAAAIVGTVDQFVAATLRRT